jgi:multimeric flavodoxin WrbA
MGSPRIKGNTDLLLDEALKGAQSQGVGVEKIVVDKLKIAPCKEYLGCFKDGNCVIRDDMDSIYSKLLEADGIIVASPMFFYSVPAQLKALIDRCQALWARRHILHSLPEKTRKGAFIAVGATKGKRLFDGSILTIKYFFEALGAPPGFFSPVSIPACFSTLSVFSVLAGHNNSRSAARVVSFFSSNSVT